MKGKILKGKRVVLRPSKPSDAVEFFIWFKNKEVVRYLHVQKPPKTLDLEKKWISDQLKSSDNILFTIINETKEMIGDAILRLNKSNKSVTIGIVIGETNHWGKGYAPEVVELLINYAFRSLKYNRCDLLVAYNNHRARQVYKKLGFIQEGIQRQAHWNIVTKQFEDIVIMSLLNKEWLDKKI